MSIPVSLPETYDAGQLVRDTNARFVVRHREPASPGVPATLDAYVPGLNLTPFRIETGRGYLLSVPEPLTRTYRAAPAE